MSNSSQNGEQTVEGMMDLPAPASVDGVDTVRAEWKAHWRALLTVTIGIASGYSVYQYSASQFIGPWQEQFGWSRGEIALAHNGLLLSALLSPWVGRLFDRHGVRRAILIGMALTGVGYLAIARMGGSLIEYYGVFLFLQLVGLLTTGLSFTRVIVARFRLSRGTSLAVSRIGMAVSGMILPGLVHAMIVDQGWRAGFVLLAGITLLIGLPLCWWGIKDVRVGGSEDGGRKSQPSFARLIRSQPKIILICLAAGLHYSPIAAILSQLQPLLVSKQIDAADAAIIGGVFAGAALLGTLISGLLIDRIWAPLIGWLFAIGPVTGCVLLMQDSPALWTVIPAVALLGMSIGAEVDIVAYLTARYFGLSSFSSIYGLVWMSTILCTFFTQVAIGFAFDHFGNYQASLATGLLLLLGASFAYLAMGRYPAATK